MKICIVAHHARRAQAERLAADLDAHVILDEVGLGALWGHRKALEWAAKQNERVVVMEDDALPVAGFRAKAQAWLDAMPTDLVSLYLGTGRPPQYQPQIAHALRRADQWRETYITLPQLIHGVCYSIPAKMVRPVLDRLPDRGAADFAVGNAWKAIGGKHVVYAVRSLVEHEDCPSVEKHPDGLERPQVRRAWRLDEDILNVV